MTVQDAPETLTVSAAPTQTAATAPAASSAARPSRLGDLARAVLPPVVVLVAFVGVWYLLSYAVLAEDKRFIMPPPHQIVQESFLDAQNRAELLNALWQSTIVAFLGLGISIVLGFVTAIVMSQAKWAERAIFPYAVVLQSVPILALVPLIGFAFDYGMTARLIVCVIISLFPIITNTLFGLQSVEPGQRDLFALHKASRWTRLTKLQFPAALPLVFTGLRISAGLSVVGAIVGDLFFKQGTNPGIGSVLGLYLSRVQFPQMYGAILLSSALGVAVFWFFGWLGQKAIGSWHVSGDHR